MKHVCITNLVGDPSSTFVELDGKPTANLSIVRYKWNRQESAVIVTTLDKQNEEEQELHSKKDHDTNLRVYATSKNKMFTLIVENWKLSIFYRGHNLIREIKSVTWESVIPNIYGKNGEGLYGFELRF